jgi:hypothetical protein
MRIYKVTYPTHGEASLLSREFAGTKREAERLARDGRGDFAEVDVPTDKAGLIAFLNKL